MTDTADYQRGYRAGRRKTEIEIEKSRAYFDAEMAERRQFRTQIFCAALQGLIVNGNWRRGEMHIKAMGDYVDMAKDFADDAERKGVWK